MRRRRPKEKMGKLVRRRRAKAKNERGKGSIRAPKARAGKKYKNERKSWIFVRLFLRGAAGPVRTDRADRARPSRTRMGRVGPGRLGGTCLVTLE